MVSINKDKCIGCGSCEAVCPEVFKIDENMKAQVKPGQQKRKAECVKEAADTCAVDAIEY